MPRVVGIDPGTVSVDLCGLDDGRVFLDRTIPTADALADPRAFVAAIGEGGGVELVVGPSGYGLPLVRADEATDEELRLAYLAPADGAAGGGIGGLLALARELARSGLPVVYTPGVIHLESVPAHRKVNRVDMGTADKVCAAALAIASQARRVGCTIAEVSLILVELGGAFTAVLGVDGGRIVDGFGGSSGPPGLRAAGALDGEAAFLAGAVSKGMLFGGGVEAMLPRGEAERWTTDELIERVLEPRTGRERVAREAYFEGVAKGVAAMLVAVPRPREIVLSGRVGAAAGVRAALLPRLHAVAGRVPVRQLGGFASAAKHAAQGAALVADGLAGGACAGLVDRLGLREARGTVLDHLYVLPPDAARRRLGLA
ncbi:MAG TPA: DUF1464 family protein [Gemmatimonadaceae bacterium]|nr:DUF1464 family protein [Gemmatimonadaceae bacterium]